MYAVDRRAVTRVNPVFMGPRAKKTMWKSELRELQLTLSNNIRELRGQQGLSQERLALEAGVDRTVVSKIERMIANPTLEVLAKLALVLGVTVTRLFKE